MMNLLGDFLFADFFVVVLTILVATWLNIRRSRRLLEKLLFELVESQKSWEESRDNDEIKR